MAPHLRFAVEEPSQVGEARRAAVQRAEQLGFDDAVVGRIALVVTELGNNLVRHAQRGLLLIGATADGAALDVLALDAGPGMDVAACLRDGYSTAGTPGTGLGAVQRLADRFDAYSQRPGGSLLWARIGRGGARPAPAGAFTVGALSLAAPGETVCGDRHAVATDGGRLAVLVADGLGHGPIAGEAAAAVVAAFEASPFDSPARVLERGHERARSTRGAAAAAALIDATTRRVLFAGAGNIVGRLVSGIGDRTLLSHHGTLGLQIRRLADTAYEWPPHALLVMHSDGIVTRGDLAAAPGLLQRDPLLIAAWLLRDHARGRDDATVVVVRQS